MEDLKIGKVSEMPLSPLPDAIYLEKAPTDEKFKLKATTPTGEVVELDSGVKKYSGLIGNGVDIYFTVNHNLSGKDLQVSFIRVSDDERISLAWKPIDDNNIAVGTSTRFVISMNEIRVVIAKL